MELIVLLPATVFGKYINVTSIVFETRQVPMVYCLIA